MPVPALNNTYRLRGANSTIVNNGQAKQDTNSGLTFTNYHLTPGFAHSQAPIQATSVNPPLEPQIHHSMQPSARTQNEQSQRQAQQTQHEHHQASAGHFLPFSRGRILAPFPIKNSHIFSQYHVCFSLFRDHYYLWETMTHIRKILKHLCLSGIVGIIQSKIT